MKYLTLILVLSVSAMFFNSCDSVTDSKSESITKPTLVDPADNAVNVPSTTTFKWTGAADVLEIDINSNFNSPQKLSYSVSGTQFTIPHALSINTFYYWHAGNTVGNKTYWSENYHTFTTGSQ